MEKLNISLQEKVVNWLIKNDFKHISNQDCYRLRYPELIITSEEFYINPMVIVNKVTNLLGKCAFFHHWDDDDELQQFKININTPQDRYTSPSVEIETNKIKNNCFHKWVNYTGLMEQFEYCSKCNEKKGNK